MLDFVAMPFSLVHTATLVPHPASRTAVVGGIAARIRRESDTNLVITYLIEGDLAQLRVPPLRRPRVAGGLWHHTCCECFIAPAGEPGYHEFNFAPSGEWAVYAFARYREGVLLEDGGLNPKIAARSTRTWMELDAFIPLDRLSVRFQRTRLTIGLSAVMEGEDDVLSYWALRHPPGNPDFHHRDSFALELE